MEVSKMRFLFLNIAFLAIYFNNLLFVVNYVYVWVCVGVSGVSGNYELSEGRVIGEVTLVLWKSVCSSPLNNLSNPRNI